MDFADWLKAQMKLRGWNCSELARRTGFSQSTFSKVTGGLIPASCELCIALAPALELPPETVLRQAGYLPAATENETLLVEAFRQLPPDMQAYLLHLIRASVGYDQPLNVEIRNDNKPGSKNIKTLS